MDRPGFVAAACQLSPAAADVIDTSGAPRLYAPRLDVRQSVPSAGMTESIPANARAAPLCAGAAPPLRGSVRVPGDKSISHRALMLGALAEGTSVVRGLSTGDDVARTRGAVIAL